MTKQELVDRIYRMKGLPPETTKRTVALIIDAVFAEISDYFVKAKLTRIVSPRFNFPGFGTFTKRRRAERRGRNPRTKEPITIPPIVTLAFAPGQDLRELLNRPGASK